MKIQNAQRQHDTIPAKTAKERDERYQYRLTAPNAHRVIETATGRQGTQVGMWGLFLVIAFDDEPTNYVLRDMGDLAAA